MTRPDPPHRSRNRNIAVARVRCIVLVLTVSGACTILLLNGIVVLQLRHPYEHDLTLPSGSATGESQLKPTKIAHAVSLIKCGGDASVKGFLDAAAVLRHSIHKTSAHTEASGSKYSYQMFAFVHENCKQHSHALDRLGYISIVKSSPVLLNEIKPGSYRDHVEQENCCGSAEFIKLYAYTLVDYPVTVHWDMDVLILQPLDDLFDSIIFPKSSPEGRRARESLELQHPDIPLPDQIDAFFTRDITSARPWEKKQGVQGGFLVARPSLSAFQDYQQFIREGNYTLGRGKDKGWGGIGYGGFQGAMAYQGVVAYFYDQLRPGSAVDLDVCLWNQVVADVVWRGPMSMEAYGQCREHPPKHDVSPSDNTPENNMCKDCRIIPVDKIKTVHYTACRKPWSCTLPHPWLPENHKEYHRISHLTNITSCGLLFKKWFDFRLDYENELLKAGVVEPSPRIGIYENRYFGGYCKAPGKYIQMIPPPGNFDPTSIYGM